MSVVGVGIPLADSSVFHGDQIDDFRLLLEVFLGFSEDPQAGYAPVGVHVETQMGPGLGGVDFEVVVTGF